jgi:hypothetical protein
MSEVYMFDRRGEMKDFRTPSSYHQVALKDQVAINKIFTRVFVHHYNIPAITNIIYQQSHIAATTINNTRQVVITTTKTTAKKEPT